MVAMQAKCFCYKFGIAPFPFEIACQFFRQRMGWEGAQMLPGGCPESGAFRGSIFECVGKQTDAEDDFVRPVRKNTGAVFGQEFAPELDLVLVLGFALSGSDAG